MWIKYSGKEIYNSEKLRGVLPGSKIDVNELLAQKLIRDHPKWFTPCHPPLIMKPKEEKVEPEKEEEKAEPDKKTKKKEEVKKK